ncbi:MAG: carotenoid oxygenase family protein [Cyanobacteria bacterium P01_H01_bin.74]
MLSLIRKLLNTKTNGRYQSIPFAPVKQELTHTAFDIEGIIPEELNGTYLRNGPNPAGPISPNAHYFSGDGMVHGVRLKAGKVLWYRNRFVRGGSVSKTLGEKEIGGPVSNGLDVSPNTNIIRFKNTLYATIEAGPSMIQLSPELDSISRSNLEGILAEGFTGHHKIDPEDKDIHGVVYCNKLGNNALYIRLKQDGSLLNKVTVPLSGASQIHDMAITKNYAIILDLNVVFSTSALLKTTLPIAWQDKKASRVGVLPKGGTADQIRWFEVSPCYVYHPLNAFEDAQGNIVLDVSRYERASLKDYYGPLGDTEPSIDRWTLPMNSSEKKAKEDRLFNLPLDFPKVNPQFEGRSYQYGYTVEATLKPSFERAVKLNLMTSEVEYQAFDGGMSSELTFIPRENATTEDDGWLIGFVFQPEKQQSRLVILDAKKFSEPPVASIWIPEQYVPIGTHGGWFPN